MIQTDGQSRDTSSGPGGKGLLFNVTGTDVDKFDTFVTKELQSDFQVFGLLDGNSGMLVVTTRHGLGVSDNFQQVNQVQAVLPVCLEVIDFATTVFKMVIAPTSECFLLDVYPAPSCQRTEMATRRVQKAYLPSEWVVPLG